MSKRFYIITAVILLGLSIIPIWHFWLMLKLNNYYSANLNITLVIPFFAVSLSILIGFLSLPLLKNISPQKSHLIIFLFSISAFWGLSLFPERIAARLDVINILLSSRRRHPSDEIAELMANASIPIEIRIHYYIFSIILVMAALSWLYNFSQKKRGFLILQGIVIICYAFTYLFVRVVQYENFAVRHITIGSVISAAACFILAALAMGLFSVSFLKYKIIPPLVSILIVVILYTAQYFMLDGEFYLYSEIILISWLLRILIAIIPGIIVYLLLKFNNANEKT